MPMHRPNGRHELIATMEGGRKERQLTAKQEKPSALRQAFWGSDPTTAARALLEVHKDFFRHGAVSSIPMLFMSRGDEDIMIVGDAGLSLAKVAAWVRARVDQFSADRWIMTVGAWGEPLAIAADQRKKRTMIVAACEDRADGFAFAWTEVVHDPKTGRVVDFRDDAPLDIGIHRVMLEGALPVKIPSPTADPLGTSD